MEYRRNGLPEDLQQRINLPAIVVAPPVFREGKGGGRGGRVPAPGGRGGGRSPAPRGKGNRHHQDRFRARGAWSNSLTPLLKINRGRDWFQARSGWDQHKLLSFIGPAKERPHDYTKGSWMEALGFTMTQLLRHSHRGPDHRYGRKVDGLVDLRWQSDASLSVAQIVEQPGCRLL